MRGSLIVHASLYTAIYLITTACAIVSALVAWRRRGAPGGRWLVLLAVAIVVWTGADALDTLAATLNTHVLWGKVSYLGSGAVPALMLLFALEYTHRSRLVTPPTITALLFSGVLIAGSAFTNDFHHLLWPGFSFAPGINAIVYAHGPLYWAINTVSYAIMLTAMGLLIGFGIQNRQIYRDQSIALAVATMFPVACSMVYDFVPGFLPGLDTTAIGLAVTCVILTYTMVRFKLLDIVPVAREVLVENMVDGLLVMDQRSRVLDINPAAIRLLSAAPREWIGRDVTEMLRHWPDLAAILMACGEEGSRGVIVSPEGRHLSIMSSPVLGADGTCNGDVVIVRDVTEQQTIAETLRARLAEIESLQAELREQAIRDQLTGMYNRRYLDEALEREIGRAEREGYPVSLVMIDVDHFKVVNDTYGHAAGDSVLRIIGDRLRSETRLGDMACRLGGDEFLVLLPNTEPSAASVRAENWRRSIAEAIGGAGGTLAIAETTISLGVAAFPNNGHTAYDVLAAADAAVYAAKAAGRNRVLLAV